MNPMIPYGRQLIDDTDVQSVLDVLRSDFLTQGPMVPRFEKAVAERCKALHGVAANSATSALHVAYLALGLKAGDWLWTSPNTFVATSNCAMYCGARVDFVDIDPVTYNMSMHALAAKLEMAERTGSLPKIVVPVHFAGQSCDMAALHELSRRYGFKVVEDASHAIGGEFMGAPIGNCAYSDITVFSFHPVKIITTAEGGMAMTNDVGLAERMRLLRTHGVTRMPEQMERESHGGWYYEQVDLGFNYRMTDLQAALGLSQHARIEHFVRRRHEIAHAYDEQLAELPLVLPMRLPSGRSALHLYVIKVDERHGCCDRSTLFDRLRRAGIGVNVHYIPVHTQPYYERLGFRRGQYPEAERYYATALSLPIYSGLLEEEQARVIAALRATCKR